MAHEQNPGTAGQSQILFTNDAQTLLEIVCPANPLPVYSAAAPTGTQDVNIVQTGGVTQLRGAGAVGTGSERIAVGQDTTTIAGSAPGTAGTASANVVTVQGVASMTPILATITPVASTTLTATQVTVPATANGILVLAANANRKGATVSNPGSVTVYISAAATGLTTTNGFGIPPGSSYNIDEPLYTGAIYGIIATSTQVVTCVELT